MHDVWQGFPIHMCPNVEGIRHSVDAVIGLPRRLSGKESACQCKRLKFDPCIRKILWRRKWQPSPALLPRKAHGQRCLAGYSLWSHKGQTWLGDWAGTQMQWLLRVVLLSTHWYVFTLFILRFRGERRMMLNSGFNNYNLNYPVMFGCAKGHEEVTQDYWKVFPFNETVW